jgi:hypothetical protein
MSSNAPNPLQALLAAALANPAGAVAAREAARKFQDAQPRWLAAVERARAYRSEHPQGPLPSELSGTVSEMIGEAEALEKALVEAFGSALPEQTRAGLQVARPFIEMMRAFIRGAEN